MATTRVSDLVTIASRLSGISQRDILGASRLRFICRVRQAVMYAATLQQVHSLPQIGRVFNKDHTTVVNAKRKVPDFMARDPEYLKFIWEILATAADEEPFINRQGPRFEFTLSLPKLVHPKPKPKPVEEEPFYYGGGYSMNRE